MRLEDIKKRAQLLDVAVSITNTDLVPPGPTIVWCNDILLKMSGYTLRELVGNSPRIFQHPGCRDEETLDRLKKNLKNGEYFEGLMKNARKDNSMFYMHWCVRKLELEDGDYFVAVQRALEEPIVSKWDELEGVIVQFFLSG